MSTKTSPPGDFRKILESLSHRHDGRRIFDAFARMAACALAAETREAEYLEEAKRWEKADLGLFAEALGALVLEMESRPFEDVLGGYYMEFALSSKGQQWNGEFHTPKPICDLMASMTLGDMESLPAGANHRLRAGVRRRRHDSVARGSLHTRSPPPPARHGHGRKSHRL